MYNKMDYGMPSRQQLAAAARFGINVTSEMDAQDVSDLLSRQLRQDPKEPNPGLIEFARNRGIHFANGIGKRALYNRIWKQLPQYDKFAFFSFCVYRYLSDDRNIADMDKSPHKESFYKFADRCMKFARYTECLEDFEGEELRCFGELIINKGESSEDFVGGGDTGSDLYNDAVVFLIENGLITEEQDVTTKFVHIDGYVPTEYAPVYDYE